MEREQHLTVCQYGATFKVWHDNNGIFSTIFVEGTGIVKGTHQFIGLPVGDPSGDMAQRTIAHCRACQGDTQRCVFSA